MGADLYRAGYDAICEAARPEWDAALQRRNAAFEAAEAAGTLVYGADDLPLPPNVVAPPEVVAAQAELGAAWEAMHPPSHYFRDSYNSSSLFWLLDLHWWEDLQPLLGPAGDGVCEQSCEGGECWDRADLYPAGARRLIAELESRRDLFESRLSARGRSEREYFTAKLSRLTAFLHDAAEAGDVIYCSV